MPVFAASQVYGGGFRADLLSMDIAGQTVQGMMLQSVNFQYSQQINMLYEIGSNYVYYVGGRAQGQLSIAHIVGPAQLTPALLENFKDLCSPSDLRMTAQAGCGDGAGMQYLMEDAVLQTLGGSVTAQECVITQSLQLMFLNMETFLPS